jgi:hypothetical protein
MIWVGHVACRGEMRTAYRILVVKPEGNTRGDLGVHRKIILKWILNTVRAWTGVNLHKIWTYGRPSQNCREFLDQLSTAQEDPIP